MKPSIYSNALILALTSTIFCCVAQAQSNSASPIIEPVTRVVARDVEKMSPDETLALFKTLPCPSMEEMNGEFTGQMLKFPSLLLDIYWGIASRNPIFPGIWRGKSFRQIGPREGRGYNTGWRLFVGALDMWPMATSIGPSYFDGKPSFRLIYRAFDHYAGDIHMVDELRRLPDGRYLGIGRTGATLEERRVVLPFLLKQRIGDYRKDVGESRQGFNLAAELKLLDYPDSAYIPVDKQVSAGSAR